MQWGSDFWWLDCLFPDKAFSDSRQEPLTVFSPLASHASLSISCSFLYTFCITLSWILSTQHSNWVQKYCCYSPLDFMNEWHIEHIWSIAFVNTTLLQCVLRQISYHCYCCHSDSFVPCFAKKNQSAHLKKLCLLCTCQVFFRIIFTFSFLNYCSKISKISSRAPCPIYSRTLLVTILNIVCVHVHPKFSCYVAARIGGEFGGEWTHVYVWLSLFVVHLKFITTLLISYTPKSFLASLYSFSWFFS